MYLILLLLLVPSIFICVLTLAAAMRSSQISRMEEERRAQTTITPMHDMAQPPDQAESFNRSSINNFSRGMSGSIQSAMRLP